MRWRGWVAVGGVTTRDLADTGQLGADCGNLAVHAGLRAWTCVVRMSVTLWFASLLAGKPRSDGRSGEPCDWPARRCWPGGESTALLACTSSGSGQPGGAGDGRGTEPTRVTQPARLAGPHPVAGPAGPGQPLMRALVRRAARSRL